MKIKQNGWTLKLRELKKNEHSISSMKLLVDRNVESF